MDLRKVQPGERIDLTKDHGAALTKFAVGIEWHEKSGIVADCDISIVLLDKNGYIITGSNGPNMPKCLCYYNQLELPGIKSYGDNLTGNDDELVTPTGSDEQIDVDFSKLETVVHEIVIVATTHSQNNGKPGKPLPFGRVASPVLTIYDNFNSDNPEGLYVFELDEDISTATATAVEVAKFYKKDKNWRYVSMADEVGTHPYGLQGIIDKYNIR